MFRGLVLTQSCSSFKSRVLETPSSLLCQASPTWQQGGSFLKESGSDAVPHLTIWCLEKELLVARRLDTPTATRSLVPACITCGSFQGSCVVLAVHTSQGWRQCVLGTTAIYIARKPSVLFPLGEGGFPPSPATHIPHLRGMNTP